MKALRAIQAEKHFDSFRLSASLEIDEAETVVVAGPSGCGKSTLLTCLAGLVPLDAGSVELFGMDARDLPPWKRRSSVVFQEPALFPHLSVAGNIGFGPFMRGAKRRERAEIVRRRIAAVHLEGKERRRIWELSGGERQRVAIARALAASPTLLLMDEPFSALDAPLRASLRVDFKEMASKEGFACLFVTHDRDEAASLAHRLIIMNKGQIVEAGSPYEVFKNPRTAFAADFLGLGSNFEAEVLEVRGPKARVRTLLGTFWASMPRDPLEVGQQWSLFMSSDALSIEPSSQAEDGRARLKGRIATVEFERDRYRCAIALSAPEHHGEGNITMVLRIPADCPPPHIDESVGISVHEDALRLVRWDPPSVNGKES